MNNAKPKPPAEKTLAEQKARTTEAHPDVELDIEKPVDVEKGAPDFDLGDDVEQTPPTPSTYDALPDDETCGATRYQQGGLRICTKPLGHPDRMHGDNEGRGWRRSGGDGPHRAAHAEPDAEADAEAEDAA